MDEFVCSVYRHRMESSTNRIWNELGLNSKWSVGCVSDLIQSCNWKNKEEWESFYYQSGKDRNLLIKGNEALLNNFLMPYQQFSRVDRSLQQINFWHGRTKEDLAARAQILYEHVKDDCNHLSFEDCCEIVRFRTICQTWNGIVVAEKKCIELLHRELPFLTFKKSTGEDDYSYAIDYEVFSGDVLIAGIQIKPLSYLGNTLYLQDARRINNLKFSAYRRDKNAIVIVVIYERDRTTRELVIRDIDGIKKQLSLLSKNSQ